MVAKAWGGWGEPVKRGEEKYGPAQPRAPSSPASYSLPVLLQQSASSQHPAPPSHSLLPPLPPPVGRVIFWSQRDFNFNFFFYFFSNFFYLFFSPKFFLFFFFFFFFFSVPLLSQGMPLVTVFRRGNQINETLPVTTLENQSRTPDLIHSRFESVLEVLVYVPSKSWATKREPYCSNFLLFCS